MNSPAFEIIRRHKEVSYETEALVLKKVGGKVSSTELITIFENGISGQYGKLYSVDPQTLMNWVNQYLVQKNSNRNYLEASLLPVSTPSWEVVEWDKEANKCFKAFLNGINEQYFHPGVYSRLMLDGKIEINAYRKYYKGDDLAEVSAAQQKILKDVFSEYQAKGFTTVYFIR